MYAGRWTASDSSGAGTALSGGSETESTIWAEPGSTRRKRPSGSGTAPVRPANTAPSCGNASRIEPNTAEGSVDVAEVVLVAEQIVKLSLAQALANGLGRQQPLAEAHILIHSFVGGRLDEVVGVRAAQAGVHEGVQDALRIDHAVEHVEIGQHALRPHHQPR